MAELLIQARGHWMDNFTQTQIDALSERDKKSREARIQLGDIVVVKPDGWTWGKEECLPRYIVVKLPGISVDTVEHLTEHLLGTPDINGERPILKKRKWQIPTNWMQSHLTENSVTINLSQAQTTLLNNLVEKTS